MLRPQFRRMWNDNHAVCVGTPCRILLHPSFLHRAGADGVPWFLVAPTLKTDSYKVHAALVQYAQQRETLRTRFDLIDNGLTRRVEVAGAIHDWLSGGGTLLELFGDCAEATQLRAALLETETALAPFLQDLAAAAATLERAVILDAQGRLDTVLTVVQGVIGSIEVNTDFGSPPSNRRVFISYDTREIEIALWIASALERRLNGRASVFVAKRDLGPGDDFLRVMLEQNLRQAGALIALCSRRSKTSPWLWWESSAVWAQNGLVIPMFLFVTPADFPGPLTLICQGRQLSVRAEVGSAIDAVVRRIAPEVSAAAVSDDEFTALEQLLSSHQPGRFKHAVSSSVDSPLDIYFGGGSEVARALTCAFHGS